MSLIVVLVLLGVFGALLYRSMNWAGQRLGPALYRLEERGPS